jgi:hypothetical protein
MELAYSISEHTKILLDNLNEKISGNFKPKFRWVLWTKPVESKKSNPSVLDL